MIPTASASPRPAPATSALGVEIRNLRNGNVIEVHVSGPLDADTVPTLRQRMLDLVAVRQPACLKLDLDQVTESDDTAIASFLAVQEGADEVGATVVIANPSEAVRRAIEAAGDDGAALTVESA